ncbi:MAG: hypothetical protein J6A92_04390 [Lachnospiraceae bacterium]|nr:hypothetical protein [Lachnospiraceae bacterium]
MAVSEVDGRRTLCGCFRPVFVDCEVSKTDVGSSSVEVREKRVSIHFHLDSDNVRYRI